MAHIENLLEQTAEEITTLRRQNEVLAAKVEMIDLFAAVLFAQPPARIFGEGEDVAAKLRAEVERLRNITDDAEPESATD